jgi:eukaryotic-like serine/threonine-protein kinase
MKNKRLLLFLLLALLALTLSACGGSPTATTWAGLAADENAAYLANGSVVYAIRLSDGEELWSFPEKPSTKLVFYSNPVFTTDGQLLLGSSGGDHTLFRVDPDTGKETWSFTEARDHWVASPLVVGEMVYAPNADGTLYIFDMAKEGNDKFAWSVELGGKLWAQPVIDGTNLYITSLDHTIHEVNLLTHEARITSQLGGAIPGVPSLGEGQLYIGSFDSSMVAINTSDGSIAWTTPTESWVWGGPVLDGTTLYFGDLNGNFYSINVADGKLIDSFKPDGPILATPLFLNGQIIFVSEDGTVYSLTPGENPQSMEKLNGKLYTAPVAAGNLLLIAPFQGDFLLVALDKDGKEEWHYPLAQK